MKKLITFASFIALGLASFALPTYALPADGARTTEDEPVATSELPNQPVAISETVDCDLDDEIDCVASIAETNCLGDPDMNCLAAEDDASEDTEEDTEEEVEVEEEVEEEAEPELWPAYVSLGALALTLVLIFIINIASRSRK